MIIIHRYSKDTIKNQVWESCIIEEIDKITLLEVHMRKDYCKIIKQVEVQITPQQAEAYKESNKQWCIEVFTKEI